VDGWCGNCDGFARQESREGARKEKAEDGRSSQPVRVWTSCASPLDVEDVQSVSVARVVREKFAHRYGCTDQEAEIQIRSLLEDLILSGHAERNENGLYRISFNREGYGLRLSSDAGVVIGYSTRHRERTWAQYKAGVPSRTSRGNSAKTHTPGWAREALRKIGPSEIQVSWRPFRHYAREREGITLSAENVTAVLGRLRDHLAGEILPAVLRQEHGGGSRQVVDAQGWTWKIEWDGEEEWWKLLGMRRGD
jgi:hypothetical protein